VGLWSDILCTAEDEPIPVIDFWTPHSFTSHSIASSPLYSPLLLEILLESIRDNVHGILYMRTMLDEAALQEYSFPQEAYHEIKTLSLWKLWPIEGFI